MPIARYLSGNFCTTWEQKAAFFGKPGFTLTPDGLSSGPPPRERLSDEKAAGFVSAIQLSLRSPLGYCPDWNETGPPLFAGTLSYTSYGNVASVAARYRADHRLRLLPELPRAFSWLPVDFDGLYELGHPWDSDASLEVGSSIRLHDEVKRFRALLEAEPQAEELAGIAEGEVVTGGLCEFLDMIRVGQLLERVSSLSVEHRTPIVVEQ